MHDEWSCCFSSVSGVLRILFAALRKEGSNFLGIVGNLRLKLPIKRNRKCGVGETHFLEILLSADSNELDEWNRFMAIMDQNGESR